jgi:hypothetical protein
MRQPNRNKNTRWKVIFSNSDKIDACLELKAIGKVKRSQRKDEDEKTPCK